MEHQNKLNVAKIIACILIMSVLVQTISAAPVDEKKINTKVNKNKAGRKSMPDHPRMFSKKDFEAWTNPCVADGYVTENGNAPHIVDRTEAYKKIRLSVDTVREELKNNDKINISNEAFDAFNAIDYEFLPTKPTNFHKQWHVDLQIYVASFGLLYKEQFKKESEYNENVFSTELHEIFKAARDLLCAIEDFVNATSTERISSDDWFTKKEMRSKLQFKNLTAKLTMHRAYAKRYFTAYIKKLHDRIQAQIKNPLIADQPNSNKHPKLKALTPKKTTRRPARNWGAKRKNQVEKLHQQQKQQNGEMSSAKRVHIIRTTNRPTQFMKKKDRSQKRQRRTTTTIAAATSTVTPIQSTKQQ